MLAEIRYESDDDDDDANTAAAPQRISFFLFLSFFYVFSLRL